MIKTFFLVSRVSLVILLTPFGKLVGAGEVKPSWQMEWEKTVAAAKQEGQVNIYIAEWGAVLDADVFQRAYPGIKVAGVTLGNSNLVAQRIMSERRAGKYLADVAIVGSSQMLDFYRNGLLQPLKPSLVLPDVWKN